MISITFFLIIYLSVFFIKILVELFLEIQNMEHMIRHSGHIPGEFINEITIPEFKKSIAYGLEKIRFELFENFIDKILFLFVILSGILPWWADRLSSLGFVAGGLLFIGLPSFILSLIGLPFEYYAVFSIESKYGFNTTTKMLWVKDLIQNTVLTVIFGGILLCGFLIFFTYTGRLWWIVTWLFFWGFQLVMQVIYPTIIAPIFNKFEPIADDDLKKDIESLAQKAGIPISGIFQMDASKRTRHTNAYFTGIGKTKRIVLYDSLIESHSTDEILAILAHEIGHLKKRHIVNQLIIMGITSFIGLFAASRLIEWQQMYHAFGFHDMPAYVGLFLLGVIWEPIGFYLSPLGAALSRKFEKEADRYVFQLTQTTVPMTNALKRLAKDNLANLNPHPVYAAFYYSHPPLVDRIRFLDHLGNES